MNKSAHFSAAIALAATAGFATAASLEIDRAYASELKADAGTRNVLNVGNASNVEVEASLKFTYTYNNRSDNPGGSLGDDDTTVGFAIGEAAIRVSGDITENMRGTISFDFGPNDGVDREGEIDSDNATIDGVGILEDAFFDWTVNDDFTLRIGQFVPNFSSEANTSEMRTHSLYRSVSHEFINTPSYTQGVEAWFGGDNWTGTVGFTDGIGTGNTDIDGFSSSAIEADYALHGRLDFYSDSDKARFDDQTSWRGSSSAWRVGAGILWQTMGDTNPSFSPELDAFFWDIDAAYEADGWTVRAGIYGYSIDGGTGADFDDMGCEIAGSVFMSEQWELFGRWDIMMLDDNGNGLISSGPAVEDTFNFVSIGANYYFVPESHAAVFTIELGISLDETSGISTPAATGTLPFGDREHASSTGYLQDIGMEDGQIMVSGGMRIEY